MWPPSKTLRRALPYALLFLQVLVFFRHVLFVPGYVIPWDMRGLHLPHAYLYADSLAQGKLPLWDPYTYCGRPELANMQTAVLYPTMPAVAALGILFGRDTLLYWLEWNVAWHVALAGIFAFRLLRALGASLPAAYFGATTYQLSGFFAAHAEHMGATMIAAWLPFALLCVYRWHRQPGWRPALLLAAGLALAVLAGNAPMTAVVFAACVLFAILLVILNGGRMVLVAMTLAASGAAFFLSLGQLAPTYELTRNSVAQFRNEWLSTGGGSPPAALVSLILPNHYHIFEPAQYRLSEDLTFMYLYSGLLGLLFAAAGVALVRRAALNRVFAVLLLSATAATLGDTTALGRAAQRLLPVGIRIALHPEDWAAVLCLSLAALAGLTLERLVRGPRLAWAVALLAAADLIAVSSGRPMNAFPAAGDPGVSRAQMDGHPERLQRMFELTGASNLPSRVDTVDDSSEWAASAPISRIYTANGMDVMAGYRIMQARLAFVKGERWGAYYQIADLRSPVIALMNIQYVLSRERLARDQLAGSPFRETAEIPGSIVYQNGAVLPRFFLVRRTRGAQSLEQAAALLKAPDFDPAREAIVEGAPGLEGGGSASAVAVVKYGPLEVNLSVETGTPAYLVTSETQYPGWRAYVDGKPQTIFYTNVAFRGLPVPAGRHSVEMRFETPLFWSVAAVSAVAWLVWVVLYLRAAYMRRAVHSP